MPLPLTIVSSPYRDITQPVVSYVKRLRRESPHDIVTVYIPEYVLGHWWEQALHNQSALRLKARLLSLRGVVVASVPYQLKSVTGSYPDQVDPLAGRAGQRAGRLAARPGGRMTLARRLSSGRDALHAAEVQAELTGMGQAAGGAPATPISDSHQGSVVDVAGTLRAVTLRPRGPSLTMEADLWDGTGSVTLVWLGRRDIAGIEPGRKLVVHGRLATIKGERTIFNPTYELLPTGAQRT